MNFDYCNNTNSTIIPPTPRHYQDGHVANGSCVYDDCANLCKVSSYDRYLLLMKWERLVLRWISSYQGRIDNKGCHGRAGRVLFPVAGKGDGTG